MTDFGGSDNLRDEQDRDAIKARAKRVYQSLTRSGGGSADLLNLTLDDVPALLAAVEEADRERESARGAWYDAVKMVKFWKERAESSERRVAAVEAAWYSATEQGDSGVLYTDAGEAAMDAIWAALHPATPVHDKQGEETKTEGDEQ